MTKHPIQGFGKGRGGRRTGLGLGLLTALGLLAATLSLGALLISRGSVSIDAAGGLAKGFYALALTAGCWLTARRARAGKLLWAGALAVLLFGAATLPALALTEGAEANLGPLLLITLGGLLLGGLLGARKKRSGYE